ncbi:MAG: 23S rRNA (adenine(2030)-N(6))-methyltransferase RlmJ [Burkholderiaceae bacterium]|nr:23S rRNA (adenine(2030)-N(6))-methyltransferase RlmJ [Burkholderiaceae bacterium]MCD8516270.1 23S rRNA (adenine(2030)-N(6))-methyltransferase RlmJ [Burkholderiaceae bacterium]MCD8536680.1 23S rRNA (adenine(2030)-N(6))-methyltransferase RlmJ [Burkholderiaceae bacterium]MCD8564378.1 23S rRNA (adenine(2030)-N(6))-methyltransferase RlmJ [Burkholderiaceae bacterium]
MFSYRHGFHAGNHADVLKHCVLLGVLNYFKQKETGFVFVDTHAGAGLYDLTGKWANTRSEYADGIGRLWSANQAPELVTHYLAEIKELNPNGELSLYPGSPWLALQTIRTQDRLRLFELLAAEADVLAHNLAQQRRLAPRAIKLEVRDGFAALKSVLPPPTRRALVLIDPAYENKQDYRSVVQTIKDALTRFSTGCYLVWYPRVNRLQVEQMLKQLQHLPGIEWLQAELTVSKAPVDQHGLFGSGLLVINPPYTLYKQLSTALPWLAKELAQDSHAGWKLRSSSHKTAKTTQTNKTTKSSIPPPVARSRR